MESVCDRCGKIRDLTEYAPNQERVLHLCAICLKIATEKRSAAALGKAGRPPKSDSQIEATVWKCYFNTVDSKSLERALIEAGYTGRRNEMLKKHLLDFIKHGRQHRQR